VDIQSVQYITIALKIPKYTCKGLCLCFLISNIKTCKNVFFRWSWNSESSTKKTTILQVTKLLRNETCHIIDIDMFIFPFLGKYLISKSSVYLKWLQRDLCSPCGWYNKLGIERPGLNFALGNCNCNGCDSSHSYSIVLQKSYYRNLMSPSLANALVYIFCWYFFFKMAPT